MNGERQRAYADEVFAAPLRGKARSGLPCCSRATIMGASMRAWVGLAGGVGHGVISCRRRAHFRGVSRRAVKSAARNDWVILPVPVPSLPVHCSS